MSKKELLIFVVISILCSPLVLAEISMLPKELDYTGMLRNGHAVNNIYISSDSDQITHVDVEVSGNLEGLVNIEPSENLVVSKDLPLTLKVELRANLPHGQNELEGSVSLFFSSQGTEITSASDAAGSIPVEVYVTENEHSDLRAGAFEVRDGQQRSPLDVRLSLSNNGNVESRPTVNLLIDGKESYSVSEYLSPLEGKHLFLNPSAESLDEGNHLLQVTVIESGKTVSNEYRQFTIVPSLLEKGNIIDVVPATVPVVGEASEVRTYFRNTGESVLVANLKGSIWDEDDRKVKDIDLERVVPAGKTLEFIDRFMPDTNGLHVFRGKVAYGNTETDVFEKVFTVYEEGEAIALSSGILLGSVLFAILYILMLYRYASRKNE